ncbi:hypothetical protein A6R68_15323 [Neotoma lepida]|uniref:Uncharacterized protein n=1 Tax=Neotoma lepida TaxID=56216 RepID=A0A1A6H6A7_NEOLE|nr:hypothetical protein A6R68_15323 [Neotoma lepida]
MLHYDNTVANMRSEWNIMKSPFLHYDIIMLYYDITMDYYDISMLHFDSTILVITMEYYDISAPL